MKRLRACTKYFGSFSLTTCLSHLEKSRRSNVESNFTGRVRKSFGSNCDLIFFKKLRELQRQFLSSCVLSHKNAKCEFVYSSEEEESRIFNDCVKKGCLTMRFFRD